MNQQPPQKATSPLVLAAPGIVFGDIGTSQLYAIRECSFGALGIAISEGNGLGVLSLVFWSLVIVISAKYLLLVMRTDNHGEDGVLALTAFYLGDAMRDSSAHRGASRIIVGFGLFCAALLFGDGVITPAISVVSAIEGLKVATPIFEPYIVPLTLVILIGLFLVQKHGTTRIGRVFGPIVLLWFVVLFLLGLSWIVENPAVLWALSPIYGIELLQHESAHGFIVLSAVFLVVTVGEASTPIWDISGEGRFNWAGSS